MWVRVWLAASSDTEWWGYDARTGFWEFECGNPRCVGSRRGESGEEGSELRFRRGQCGVLVVLRPAFFGSEDSLLTDMSGGVVFLPEASRDPETCFVIVSMGAQLFVALSVCGESFGFSVVVPVSSGVCIEDV